MTTFFHAGERQIQAEAGTDTDAYEVQAAQAMSPELVEHEVAFIEGRTFSVAASVDDMGAPWASPLLSIADQQLFDVVDETTIDIRPSLAVGDELATNVAATAALGVLFFDPSKRRRAKSLGSGRVLEDGTIRYELSRYFGLCPKYIAKRSHQPGQVLTDDDNRVEQSTGLTASAIAQLRGSDTVFLASHHDGHGADATHRGGRPGFIRIRDAHTIEVPDYFGNMMFNTIGNLVLDQRLGLTDVDFVTGRTVQITGSAAVIRDVDHELHGPAERVIRLHVDRAVSTTAPIGAWTTPEPSSFSANYPGEIQP